MLDSLPIQVKNNILEEFASKMRGRGILVAQGLMGSKGGFFNETIRYSPLIFSRTVSTAQEKANTRAMLDRMLRFCFHQGLGTDCEAAAIGRFIPSLGQSEASIFAMRE